MKVNFKEERTKVKKCVHGWSEKSVLLSCGEVKGASENQE